MLQCLPSKAPRASTEPASSGRVELARPACAETAVVLSVEDPASVLEVCGHDGTQDAGERLTLKVHYDATHLSLRTVQAHPPQAQARLEVMRHNDLVAALEWTVSTAMPLKAFLATEQHLEGWSAELVWLVSGPATPAASRSR